MKKHLLVSALMFSTLLSLSSPSAGQAPLQSKQPEPKSTKQPEPKSTKQPEPKSTKQPEPKSTKQPEPKPTKQLDNTDSIVNTVKTHAVEMITGSVVVIIAAGASILATYLGIQLTRIQKQSEEIKQKTLDSLNLLEPLKNNEKRNSITIVGIGGTGKTTLIKKMFDKKANPAIATGAFQKYHCIKETSIFSIKINFKYYVTDYMGQNIGTLIYGMMQEQKIPYSPMTWGAINSIIFLVDVAEPPDSLGVQQVHWKERVRRHIREWSPTALDAIFGLVDQRNLQYVCLLVNKFDLLQNISEEQVKLEYKELIDAIAPRCRGIYFQCLVGSINSEDFRRSLEQQLENYSYPK